MKRSERATAVADVPNEETPTMKQTKPPPRLGDVIDVVAGTGRLVANTEYGGVYSETEPSAATVTARVLRLLQDGDLVRQ